MADLIPPAAGIPYLTIRASGEKSPLEIPADTIIQAYKSYGALLLRGFTTDLGTFARFAEQFCSSSVFNESRSRQVLDDLRNIQSVDLGTAAFPLHPELSREPWKPDVCFFACLNPPRRLGATTVCDGSDLVDRLPPSLREEMAARRLRYTRHTTPNELLTWFGDAEPSDAQLADPPARCPFTFRRNGDQIQRSFSRPFLHKPMFTDRLAFGNFLLFARYGIDRWDFPLFDDGSLVPPAWTHVVRDVGDEITATVSWRRGDILMLDNTRFLHGRTTVVPRDGRLIASYFGYLSFARANEEDPPEASWRHGGFWPPRPVSDS
ncbi:TauD/TfdA family dioxygenase [Sphingomonas sp. QA11]|uniref:TauD/TfdA family dioxygenase n=1 Tax=Sphingomonas sp. QA11 TaxID=2950605 RepID=UPI00234A3812|nr:TauD/TfdA family dioxygenase [Sphingomonas sp. QA11]WCM26155.1 TauD/TfdA family dioxygenase [Sphingomonas sp. QA11]